MDRKIAQDIRQISTAIVKKLSKEKKARPKRYKSKERQFASIRTELRNLRDSI